MLAGAAVTLQRGFIPSCLIDVRGESHSPLAPEFGGGVKSPHERGTGMKRKGSTITPTMVLMLVAIAGSAAAQSSADTAGIRSAALDYIDGWYQADGARMERALHPELAKRNVTTDSTGRSHFIQMSAMTLVQSTSRGGGSRIPSAERRDDVRILDIFGGAASVRITAATWIDYLHLARVNGRWVIINVLWENNPRG
jgi:hypothetical protein